MMFDQTLRSKRVKNKSVLELVEGNSGFEFLIPFGEPGIHASDVATRKEDPDRREDRIVGQGVTNGNDAVVIANDVRAGKGRLMCVRDVVELRKD